jgi:adenosylhomocysteine nucleosidase
MDGPRVLMLAPMRSELRPLVRMTRGRPAVLGGQAVHVGRAGRATVTAAVIGVGPPAARRSTERLLDAAGFDHVVVSGIAGGVGARGAVGALVTPAEVEDLSTGRRFTPATIGHHVPSGVLSTTAELIVDEGAVAALAGRGVVALDMETAAVAEVCEQRARPWSVFRVVSDRPEDGLLDHGVFELLEVDGTVNVTRALRYVLAKPARLRPLARLARDAGDAARRAAGAAVGASAAL